MVAPSESKAQKSAPIAVDDTYKVGYELTRSVSAVNGLLAYDTDANGAATMAVQTVPVISPSNGTVTLDADGSFHTHQIWVLLVPIPLLTVFVTMAHQMISFRDSILIIQI